MEPLYLTISAVPLTNTGRKKEKMYKDINTINEEYPRFKVLNFLHLFLKMEIET